MRDIYHKILLDLFDVFDLGDVVENRDDALSSFKRGDTAHENSVSQRELFHEFPFFATCVFQQLCQSGISHDLPVKLPFHGLAPYDLPEALVTADYPALFVQNEEAFLERVNNAVQFFFLLAELRKHFFHFLIHPVETVSQYPQFVLGLQKNTTTEVS